MKNVPLCLIEIKPFQNVDTIL